MKTPMWFVRAIGLDANGKILDKVLLTPPMPEIQANTYHYFMTSNNAGALRWALEKDIYQTHGVVEIIYACFETTLY